MNKPRSTAEHANEESPDTSLSSSPTNSSILGNFAKDQGGLLPPLKRADCSVLIIWVEETISEENRGFIETVRFAHSEVEFLSVSSDGTSNISLIRKMMAFLVIHSWIPAAVDQHGVEKVKVIVTGNAGTIEAVVKLRQSQKQWRQIPVLVFSNPSSVSKSVSSKKRVVVTDKSNEVVTYCTKK